MAVSDFKVISSKIFDRLIESFPVSQQINVNEILGTEAPKIERGREVVSDPEQRQKVRDTLNWLQMNGYVNVAGDYYSLSEKWLKIQQVDLFS